MKTLLTIQIQRISNKNNQEIFDLNKKSQLNKWLDIKKILEINGVIIQK